MDTDSGASSVSGTWFRFARSEIGLRNQEFSVIPDVHAMYVPATPRRTNGQEKGLGRGQGASPDMTRGKGAASSESAPADAHASEDYEGRSMATEAPLGFQPHFQSELPLGELLGREREPKQEFRLPK